jgi:DNA-binding NarL/FixJ family response regulator
MQPVIRIVIADDHQIVRAGLSQFLADQQDIDVVAEAAIGDELLSLIRRENFDDVLLDIAMPGKNGIDCLRVIRQIKPELRVLVLSGYPEAHYAVNLLRSGASGFISKNAPPEELIRAIRIVSRGRRYLSETAADLVSTELNNPGEKKLHESLSEREFQIFRKLAAGQSPTEIANELNLSVKTVSTYRARVLEKMNLKTNADLTYYAIKNALFD